MTNQTTIEMARTFLAKGQGPAYARIISSAIRAAMSDRSAKQFRAAIAEDKAEHLFTGLNTRLPRAKEE
jgi:hypothetical protein